MKVKSFKKEDLDIAIKQSPKIVRDYINAQKNVISGWEETFALAVKKIKEQSELLEAGE